MRPMRIVAVLLSAMLTGVPAAFAEVLGDTVSDSQGTGEILVQVDPTADPEYVRQQIIDNVRITEGGNLTEVSVANGVLSMKFAKSTAEVLVEAVIDDDIAAWLLRGTTVAGTGTQAGGLGVPGLIGAGVVVGTLTGVAVSGTLHPDDEPSPNR